jgi:hypothetical protein
MEKPFGEDFWKTTASAEPAPKEETAEERVMRIQIETAARQAGIFFNELLRQGFTRNEALALVARGLGQ